MAAAAAPTDGQTEPFTSPATGLACVVHRWAPSGPVRAVAVVFHGYGAHARYPTVTYATRLLVGHGIACFALDFPGHGQSEGPRGLIRSPEHLTRDGLAVCHHVKDKPGYAGLPLFLVGSSMGGAVALNVARVEPLLVQGCVLLAPMLRIAEEALPPAWQVPLLQGLACMVPGLAALGSNATDPSVQYADPERRKECMEDTMVYQGRMRLGSANACLQTAIELSQHFHEVQVPFLCLTAGKDVVVDKDASELLLAQASTPEEDKKNITYPEALHGLLCEPQDKREAIEADIVDWINGRIHKDGATAS